MFYNEENDIDVKNEESLDNEEIIESAEDEKQEKIEEIVENEEDVPSSDNSNLSKEKYIEDINYLDPAILDIKSYSNEEAGKFNESKDFDTTYDEKIYKTDFLDISEKSVVKGTVVAINEKGILVDIGFKSEGVIDRSEFKDLPSIGDVIDTFIVVFEDRKGKLILSKERADFEKRWDELRTAYADEKLITGRIVKRIKGGMVVDLGVVNAFLPGSQVDIKTVTDFDEYIGNEYDFKIVKFNEFRQNVVVSRKATLESMDKSRQEMMENIEVGNIMEGVVKNITDFGAFIDLGGIDGLLHITDITWGRINHPKEKLNISDQVSVKVIDYDETKHRISLGMKQLSGDPWESASDKFTINSIVKGKIVNIMNYGIFLEIEEGIEGLVHISEISWTKHIKHPSDMYKVGDKLDAMVLSVDVSQKKISLGVKQLLDNPWNEIESKYKVDDLCKGKIVNIVSSGVYIEIDSGIEGFLHNSEISWTRKIKSASDIFNINDDIEVKVIDVSVENKKILLSLKQLSENHWLNIDEHIKLNDTFEGKIHYIFDKGLIVLLSNDFEALLPKSKVDNFDDFKVGDKISAIVSEIDPESQKIVLNSNIDSPKEETVIENDDDKENNSKSNEKNADEVDDIVEEDINNEDTSSSEEEK